MSSLNSNSCKPSLPKSQILRKQVCGLDTVGLRFLRAEGGLASLRQKGTTVMELMCNQPPWPLEEAGSPAEEQQNNVQHIQAVMEEMQLRKQR